MDLIRKNWNFQKPVRLLSVTAYDLIDEDEPWEPNEQLSLFTTSESPGGGKQKQQEKIETTMDEIREKFGKGSISLGVPKKPVS